MRVSFKFDIDFNENCLWYLSALSEGEFDMADASVRLRLVGAALRRHRERLGLSIRDVASAMECEPSKISRQETGHRGVWRHELRELLDEYGINDEERHTLLRVADRRASQGWWDHYADVAPACSADYLMLETIAREIASYDSQRIPDLLQTQDYTWALAEAGPSPADPRRRKKLADMQRERQRAAMGGNQAPLDIIVGEGALRAVVGDKPGHTWASRTTGRRCNC